MPGSDETVDALVRFWGGEPLRVPELRRALRSVGAAGLFSFTPVTARELARQRFRFAARLLRAAGHKGWVILFDEVELVGRYSLLQRGRSYAELARWLSKPGGSSRAAADRGLAMTDDFEAAVLAGRDDRAQIPAGSVPGRCLSGTRPRRWHEAGIKVTSSRRCSCSNRLTMTNLTRAYAALKKLHGDAFGWSPPDVPGLERLGATRMRQYVRSWINEWDLVRLDPAFRPQTEVVTIASDYREDSALEDGPELIEDDPAGQDRPETTATGAGDDLNGFRG